MNNQKYAKTRENAFYLTLAGHRRRARVGRHHSDSVAVVGRMARPGAVVTQLLGGGDDTRGLVDVEEIGRESESVA